MERPGLFVPLPLSLPDDYRSAGLSLAARYLYSMCLIHAKRVWQTDGLLLVSELTRFCHPLSLEEARAAMAELVNAGWLELVRDGWRIVDWLLWNDPASTVEATSAKRRASGKEGATARWGVRPSPEQSRDNGKADGTLPCANGKVDGKVDGKVLGKVDGKVLGKVDGKADGTCTSLSGCTAPTAVLQSRAGVAVPPVTPGNGSTDPPAPADDPGPAWEADDPEYRLVPDYSGDEHLALWQAKLGKVQPRDHLASLHTLHRLHVHCRRSRRELTAYIEHLATNDDARKWWGVGKSPAGWLTSRDGSEPTWRKVRAHWLAAGGKLARARIRAPDPGPDPGVDRSCDCRRGWLEDQKRGAMGFCPKCARGKWLKAGGRDK